VPGDALLATVDARVLARHAGDDKAVVHPTLVVDRFVAISTQAHCDSPVGTAPLENTDWTLVSLRGKPVDAGAAQRGPDLLLQSAQRRLAGSGGCNRLSGSYELSGDRLKLGQPASTRAACGRGMEQEHAFVDALGKVARWRIDNQRLALLDEHGSTIAEFEPRAAQ
jgi:heat shock protein HslJ